MKLSQWSLGRETAFWRFLRFWIGKNCEDAIKTLAYIDGFNLYYGSLQGTPYRWLDVSALARRIAREQNPSSEIVGIKYFTAPTKAKLSPRGEESCRSQQDYILSLKAHIPNIEVIEGKYIISESHYHPYGDPVDFNTTHSVWRSEEKQTDVNIAIHMLCDAIDDKCEQSIIISNDSDLAPALAVIKGRKPTLILGAIAPLRGTHRKASAELSRYTDWTRHTIRDEELEKSQLPDKILTRKRCIQKPEHW